MSSRDRRGVVALIATSLVLAGCGASSQSPPEGSAENQSSRPETAEKESSPRRKTTTDSTSPASRPEPAETGSSSSGDKAAKESSDPVLGPDTVHPDTSVPRAGGRDSVAAGSEAGPQYGGLQGYRRRCASLDLVGARARVLYEERKQMTRGDTGTIKAAVTLDESAPPDRLLHRTGAAEEPGLLVSCRIQAQLSVSHYQFELNEKDWVERSLLTTDTTRWTWYVTPKVGGTHILVLNLRPILKLKPTNSTKVSGSAEDSNVQQYETSAHVNVPWTERPQEAMSRLAATFKVAEGLVKAVTLLAVAVLSLGAVLGVRSRRRKRTTP